MTRSKGKRAQGLRCPASQGRGCRRTSCPSAAVQQPSCSLSYQLYFLWRFAELRSVCEACKHLERPSGRVRDCRVSTGSVFLLSLLRLLYSVPQSCLTRIHGLSWRSGTVCECPLRSGPRLQVLLTGAFAATLLCHVSAVNCDKVTFHFIRWRSRYGQCAGFEWLLTSAGVPLLFYQTQPSVPEHGSYPVRASVGCSVLSYAMVRALAVAGPGGAPVARDSAVERRTWPSHPPDQSS